MPGQFIVFCWRKGRPGSNPSNHVCLGLGAYNCLSGFWLCKSLQPAALHVAQMAVRPKHGAVLLSFQERLSNMSPIQINADLCASICRIALRALLPVSLNASPGKSERFPGQV